jgi:hypothetical protein
VVSSSVTSTSLTLTWAPPLIPNGVITHYIINAVEVDTGVNITYQAQSRTTFTVGDLHPYYTYQFNVRAVTVAVGPASPSHTVTTLQDGKTVGNCSSDSKPLIWCLLLHSYNDGFFSLQFQQLLLKALVRWPQIPGLS